MQVLDGVTLPDSMTAVEIREPGGPEVLTLGARPVPRPGAGEVLVRVAGAGVNRPDCLQRQGAYPPPAGASDILGLEIGGAVVAVGDDVERGWLGRSVCALVAGGGYAEYCCAPTGQCLPVPDGMDAVTAAAIPETFFTVWSNLFQRARLKSGETLLVHGGASGIGTTAIQLARAFDVRVLCTVGSADKQTACEALGAERAINYRSEDFVEVVKQLTDGRGVEVILDHVGGPYLPRNLRCLATEGRLAQIGVMGGDKVEFELRHLLLKRLTLMGSTLRAQSVAAKSAIAEDLRARVWPLLSQGALGPIIQERLPLGDAARAHAVMESNALIGKLVLVTG